MVTIENEYLKVSINTKGAELNNIFNKTTSLEYLWNADPAFWNKKSPVLFPTVGELKNGTYYYKDKSYKLGRHGFAREMDFEVTAQSHTTATFTLTSNEATLANYPFSFVFDIIYKIDDNQLSVHYKIRNTGKEEMYFSVGAHPAFRVPLAYGTSYNDYFLEFSQTEHAGRWPISGEGLIEAAPVPLLDNTKRLPLTKELFAKDALVFKHLASEEVKLLSTSSRHGLTFSLSGFPYLGIWAFKGADFVCIEPWCGIADSITSDQQLVNKEGINQLPVGGSFERGWSVTTF